MYKLRNAGTTIYNQPFIHSTILDVWNKAKVVSGHSQYEWRYDTCVKLIRFSDYGNVYSVYGWEIDHIIPVSRGGTDNLANLQALQWKTNRKKADTYPWYCY
ncbi:HNH endonuclease [Legionella pneumophila]|uniref:HNH endonuclease signature motif containing protein n=1 Tax=Legionella pneumophila TaxID=446 RepID=UPI0005C42E44|nr:HNH endonuclease signature motif containing protein [Legionella pneumophila]GAN16110.1 HNH endonuclease [Legionella pneumophila]GAN19215.1 HNH endonuclease [Legionella pneumophila]